MAWIVASARVAAGQQASEFTFTIQVHAVADSAAARKGAEQLAGRLGGQFPISVDVEGRFHKVRVGDFLSPQSAQRLLRLLRVSGYPDAFVARRTAPNTLAETKEAQLGSTAALLPATKPSPAVNSPAVNSPAVEPTQTAAGPPIKQLRVVRVSQGAIHLDGELEERAWQNAGFISDFQIQGSDRGYPASEPTEVSVLFDDDALYIGARMVSHDHTRSRAFLSRRDNPGTAERLLVSIDTYHDRRTAYTFGVTAGGVRVDHFHPQDNESVTDATFDPVWEARTVNTASGWTAELRIPFSQLRFRARGAQVWGINFNRVKPGRDRNDYWVVIPMNETGWASRFGELTGLDIESSLSRAEVVPYLAGSATFQPQPGAGNTRYVSTRGGADLKVRLAPNLTLDAAVNPDFGQVEADPAIVNLTAFETFFPERRPFFLEGNQLLHGNGPKYFYSRRVGSIPSGGIRSGYIDAPLNASIPAAIKVTGRLNSGTSVGAMAALTAFERAAVVNPLTGGAGDVDVAPTTGVGVFRAQQEFGASASTAGLMLTGVHRNLTPGTYLADLLNRQAAAGGADWNLRFAGGAYELTGYAGFSQIGGDSSAILRSQYSSARYFQRPDADYVTLNPSRTSLSGYAMALGLAKKGGEHWLWDLGGSAISPGFEINDAGAQSLADRAEAHVNVRFRENRPRGELLGYQLALFTNAGWNFGGVRQYASPSIFTSATWRNLVTSYLQLGVDTRVQSDKLTRGGPLAGTGFGGSLLAGLSSDYSARTRWSANVYYYRDEFSGRSYSLESGLSFRPSGGFEFSLEPGISGANSVRQFFAVIGGGPAATLGNRYVFSLLRRRDLYAKARLNFALNPDVTLELFTVPFASSGRFSNFGELTKAGSREIFAYGADGTAITRQADGSHVVTDGADRFTLYNADYNVRSFRSNVVLRWEWRSGSTLFLIWQRNGFVYDQQSDLVTTVSLWGALGDRVNNIAAAKLTYWLPLF